MCECGENEYLASLSVKKSAYYHYLYMLYIEGDNQILQNKLLHLF